MTQRAPHWSFILLPIFILIVLAAAYFTLQLRRNAPPQPAGLLAADKGYGVTIDLTQYDDAALTDTLVLLRQNGLTWIRQPVSWAVAEPAPDQFDWQSLDRVFAAVARSNDELSEENGDVAGGQPKEFKLIAVLHTTPDWARPTDSIPTTPPTETSNFGNFARAFAERYGHQIDYYQIWHEPNLSANWGDTFVDPTAYADLLREAALNIRTVDSESYILTAALSATLEDGPLNLNELSFLDQLYQARADQWFDIVAIQPFGLWTKPLDSPDPNLLNFRRAELVRQVMLNHGDTDTPVWATAFGWVALPADWAGRPSPWSNDLPSVQTPRTTTAIEHARQNWPWLGPMLAARWDATGLDDNDPARGFALLETPSILEVVRTAAMDGSVATVGRYPANHPSGKYSPDWRFTSTRADIPRHAPRTLTIPFEGTRLDLHIERGLYRGNLWVAIDGQPANALPQDTMGRSYVILYDPLREGDTVTLAHHLPMGRHEAIIEADGGWAQWALMGWTVSNEPDIRFMQSGLALAGVLAVASGLGLLWQFLRLRTQIVRLAWVWSESLIVIYNILGERSQIIITFALAISLYLFPGMVALILLLILALSILLRPDLGLAVVTLSLFFFRTPLRLPIGSFSPTELSLFLTFIGFIFKGLISLGQAKHASEETSPTSHIPILNLKSTDLAALVLVILAFVATLAADRFDVSIREWRVVVFESVLFYFLVRLGLDFSPLPKESSESRRWVWRLVDAFVVGGTLQAVIALYLFFFTDQTINAEGVRRALGLGHGSPNNLALVLDRIWPILLTVTIFARQYPYRRWLYGLAFIPVSIALYLTFSKGALLLGLPISILVMAVLYGQHGWRQRWRRASIAIAGAVALFFAALIPFSQTARFRTLFDFEAGSTSFFRLKLWQASWTMLQDNWPLGVGLDNFLYKYRTRYILPEAWQEPDLSHPHNLILDFGTRLGIGGIVVLFWLQIAFWRNAWRLYKTQFDPLILGLMGSMIIFLSHGLVDTSYFLVDLAFAFFLIVGIVQRLAEQASNNANME